MPDRLYFLLADGTTYRMDLAAGDGANHRDWFFAGKDPYHRDFLDLGSGRYIRRSAVIALELVPDGQTRHNPRE
jgi:hypothetical protein